MSAPLTKVDSFQYPSGHLGHLSEGQQKALDDFKKISLERKYYTPASSADALASHDDETLLRYLRARKFVPGEAFKQFQSYEDWKNKNHLEELYDTIDVEEYEAIRRLYPQWTGRRDRRGIPVYVFKVSHLDSKTVDAYQKMATKHPTIAHKDGKLDVKLLRLFALYENLIRFVMPLCSAIEEGRPHPETPVSQSNNIVDISGVGLRQFWNLKNHMQEASQMATQYYPETLDRIFIIGAPSFFPTVWGWVKRWFDPITVSKMFILSSSDMKSTLEKYIHPDNIPKKYGGNLDFEFGSLPSLEPDIESALDFTGTKEYKLGNHRTVPSGPVRWRAGPNKTMEAFAVGSIDGVPRNEKILSIKHDIHDVYPSKIVNRAINWKLERVATTDGTDTHPKEEGDLNYGSDLQSGQSTPDPSEVGASAVLLANSNSTLPAKPDPTPEALPASASQPRAGTSDTKAAAQNITHASGQLEEGTPHLVDAGHNDKTATTEPSTVGQAPKDLDAKLPDVEHPAPSYLNQVKSVANSAYVTTANLGNAAVVAVVGGKKTEVEAEKKEPEEPKIVDERIDNITDRSVEEFLRNKTSSSGPGAKELTK